MATGTKPRRGVHAVTTPTTAHADIPLCDLERQLRLEQEMHEAGVEALKRRLNRLPSSLSPIGKALGESSIAVAAAGIATWLAAPDRGKGGAHKRFYRESALSPEQLAALCLQELVQATLDTSMTGIVVGASYQTVCRDVYRRVVWESNYASFREEHTRTIEAIKKKCAAIGVHAGLYKVNMNRAMARKMDISRLDGLTSDIVKTGNALIDIVMASTGLVTRTTAGRHVHVTLTPEVAEAAEAKAIRMQDKCFIAWPLVVPPRPWTSFANGGYYTFDGVRLVKCHGRTMRQHFSTPGSVGSTATEAINAVQSVPWRVNKQVLAVVEQLRERNLGEASLFRRIDVPVAPWTCKQERLEWEHTRPEEYRRIRGEIRMAHVELHDQASEYGAQGLLLSMARRMSKEPSFWHVWSYDVRGRMYAVTPLFQPQGSDLAKGLHEFATGKPVGEDGGRWLAILLASLYGVDKVSFRDREAWTQEHSADILACANDPCGMDWWQRADDGKAAWQFLAACFEWAGYMKEGSSYVSHARAPQDGSCSGLQHWSALLRDDEGGSAVNLVESPVPRDVYSDVALVAKRILKSHVADARGHLLDLATSFASGRKAKAEGVSKKKAVPSSDEIDMMLDEMLVWASRWDALMCRKIAKRPTMTRPYGVTTFGASDQLQALVKEGGIDWPYPDVLHEACYYLSSVLMLAIDEVVVASKQGMAYVQDVAKVYASLGMDLTWTTPSGYKARQRYRNGSVINVQLSQSRMRVDLNVTVDAPTDPVNVREAAHASAPNVIHSLDAAHLMASVLASREAGIGDVAVIHDSFACHLSDTGVLRNILREMFAQQYTPDVLGGLAKEWRETLDRAGHADVALPSLPCYGKLSLSGIRYSTYLFH